MLPTRLATMTLALSFFACDAGEGAESNEPRQAEISEHTEQMMSKLDKDSNGTLSAAEAAGSPFARHFTAADLDASGEVDADELDEFTSTMAEKHHGEGHECSGECSHHGEGHECSGECSHHGEGHECSGECSHHGGGHGKGGDHKMDPAAHVDGMMAKYDANNDGALSAEELEKNGKFGKHLAQTDADNDGLITRDELLTAMKAKHEKMRAHHADGMKGDHHGMKMGTPEEHAAKMMTKLDADGSGGISVEEASGSMLEGKFERVDGDTDGQITATELGAAIKAKHDKMRAQHGE